MKIKKLFIFITLLAIVLSVSGCGVLYKTFFKTEYEFLQDVSQIHAIEIGIMEDTQTQLPTDPPSFAVMHIVEDHKTFLKEFSKVDCFSRFTDPTGIRPGSIVFRITYVNGDYEIIHSHGQSKCEGGTYVYWYGYYYFDNNQFETFLGTYINNN